MTKNTSYNLRLTICKLSYVMNENGEWSRNMVKWKDVWADVKQSFIRGNVPYFRFRVRWQPDFPKQIAVVLNGNCYRITTSPTPSPDRSYLTFSGVFSNDFSYRDQTNASI